MSVLLIQVIELNCPCVFLVSAPLQLFRPVPNHKEYLMPDSAFPVPDSLCLVPASLSMPLSREHKVGFWGSLVLILLEQF